MAYISYHTTDCEAKVQTITGMTPLWQQTARDWCRPFKCVAQYKGPGGSEEPPKLCRQSSGCRQLPQSNLSALQGLTGLCILTHGRSTSLVQEEVIIIIIIYRYYYFYCLLVGFQCPGIVLGCLLCGLSGRKTSKCSVCLSLGLPQGWHRFP